VKTLFLTGIAALFLAAGAAHADDKLPEAMLGVWCQASVKGDANRIYYRPNFGGHTWDGCSDFDDGITLSQDGFSDDRPIDGCDYVFDKIERIKDDTYIVFARCAKPVENLESDLGGLAQLQIINNEILIVKRMPEG